MYVKKFLMKIALQTRFHPTSQPYHTKSLQSAVKNVCSLTFEVLFVGFVCMKSLTKLHKSSVKQNVMQVKLYFKIKIKLMEMNVWNSQ